jgi:hypothetical protein
VSPLVTGKIQEVNPHTGELIAVYVDHKNVEQTARVAQGSFNIIQLADSSLPEEGKPHPCTLAELTTLSIQPVPDCAHFAKHRSQSEFSRLIAAWTERAYRVLGRPTFQALNRALEASPPARILFDQASFPLNVLEPFYNWMDTSLQAAVQASCHKDDANLRKALENMRTADGELRTLYQHWGVKQLFGSVSLWRQTRNIRHDAGQRLFRSCKDAAGHDCHRCLLSNSCSSEHKCCHEVWVEAAVKMEILTEVAKGKYTTNFAVSNGKRGIV